MHEPKTLTELHECIKKWLYIKKTDNIDVILASYISLYHKGKPLWIFLIGRSGDGKTELVKSLIGLPNVRLLDQITPYTLASGKKGSQDLGSELTGRHTLLIILDLASLLSLDSKEKKKIWGQFRNLYDGYIQRDTGGGRSVHYRDCHVNMLACSTSTIKKESNVQAAMGTRELLYGFSNTQLAEDKVKMNRAIKNLEHQSQMNNEIKTAVNTFLRKKSYNEEIEIPADIHDFVIKECFDLMYLRASVEVDWYSGELMQSAEMEVPTRMIQQLYLLYKSLKSLDKNYPDDKYKNIVKNIVKESSHPIRYQLYKFFNEFEHQKNEYTIPMLQERFKVGRKAIKAQCEILWNLNLLDKITRIEKIGGKIITDENGNERETGGRINEVTYYKHRDGD